jgi:hypothetical protein
MLQPIGRPGKPAELRDDDKRANFVDIQVRSVLLMLHDHIMD